MLTEWVTIREQERRKQMANAKLADKTYYLNADKTKALPAKSVKEGQDDTPEGAAYLLVRKGSPVTDEMTEKYGVEGVEEESPAEEPGIVVSGGRDTGPGFVKVDAVAEATEGTAATTSEPAATGRKGAAKK